MNNEKFRGRWQINYRGEGREGGAEKEREKTT